MSFKLDPETVFGNETTSSARATIRLLGITLSEIERNPNWIDSIIVENGYFHNQLPKRIPKIGKTIMIFWVNGRIDRFEVLPKRKLRCLLSRNGEKGYRDINYVLKSVGDGSSWVLERGIWHPTHSKIARIVIIAG